MRNVANGKNAEKAKQLSALPNTSVVELDVTDSASINKAVEGIIAKEGRLDVLVNNAGYFAGGVAETFTEQDVENMMDVHVKGPWRLIKACLPQFRKQNEGLIVNISSGLGRFSAPFMTIYNTAKFAVEGMTEGLHYEVRPLGVDVVMLEPGAFPTELFSKSATGSDLSVLPGYGDLSKVPEQIGQGMMQLFEAMKPNPQSIADAIIKLIETPKGKRPLRTVVDAVTGNLVETANKQVKEQYDAFLTAFGMGELLK